MIKLLINTLLVTIALFVGVAHAQATPEQAAVTYFEAIKNDGVEVAPRFIHPKELERFKSMLMPLFMEADTAGNTSPVFFGKKMTSAEISAMPAEDFMAGFLSVVGTQMKGAKINLGETAVIGTVKEGDIVHVLTRSSAGNDDFKLTKVEVISMILDGDAWKLMLSGEMEGLAQALKSQFQKDSE